MITQKKLLQTLFMLFEIKQIPFCVLHSYNELPEKILSDVDICIDIDEVSLDHYVDRSCYFNELRIIQKIYYGVPTLIAYDIYDFRKLRKIAQLDFFNDRYGISWLSIKNKELLYGRQEYKSFYIPNAKNEFIYLLIKRIYKGKIDNDHKNKLLQLYNVNEKEIVTAVNQHFGSDKISILKQLLNNSDDQESITSLIKLRRVFYFRQILNKPWKWILKPLLESIRIIKRALNPTGSLLCILSPDGGGKTSVCEELKGRILRPFRKVKSIHWRPGFLPQIKTLFGKSKLENEISVTNPHSPKKRSRITSFLRWLYYSIDYIIGYYLKILPMKIKTTAIIMDRYYYDIVIDPVRYGFNLPNWLLKLPLRFIPKPDLTIYLDNKPEELYKRKQELPVSELKRQVGAWREFIPTLPNARIVTTDKPLENVVHDVTKIVLERRVEMTRKMLKVEPEASKYLWQSDITDYLALPSKKNCRWIIPGNQKLARKAWDLYQPYSLKGKLYRNYQKYLGGITPFVARKAISFDMLNFDKSKILKNRLIEVLGTDDIIMAISTGTSSPFRKITGLVMSSDGQLQACLKIGKTPLAIARIKNEAKMLKHIAHSIQQPSVMSLKVPGLLYEGEIGNGYMLIQSPTPFEGKSGDKYFNKDYENILKALINKTSAKMIFSESEFYKVLKEGIDNYSLSYQDALQRGLKYLEENIGDSEISFALTHGDFAPWNMVWHGKDAFIYDWESANPEAPAGIDLVHLLFQTGFLLKKLRGEKLLRYILQNTKLPFVPLPIPEILVLLYSLHMAVTEDELQQLSSTAVERRKIIKLVIGNG